MARGEFTPRRQCAFNLCALRDPALECFTPHPTGLISWLSFAADVSQAANEIRGQGRWEGAAWNRQGFTQSMETPARLGLVPPGNSHWNIHSRPCDSVSTRQICDIKLCNVFFGEKFGVFQIVLLDTPGWCQGGQKHQDKPKILFVPVPDTSWSLFNAGLPRNAARESHAGLAPCRQLVCRARTNRAGNANPTHSSVSCTGRVIIIKNKSPLLLV